MNCFQEHFTMKIQLYYGCCKRSHGGILLFSIYSSKSVHVLWKIDLFNRGQIIFIWNTHFFFKKNPYLSNKCFDKTIIKKLMFYFRTLQNLKKDIWRKTEENFCCSKFEDFIKAVDRTLAKLRGLSATERRVSLL